MNSSLTKTFLALIVLSTVTACYRMPNDDEFSLVPNTNNRDLTRERPQSPIPTANY